MGQLRQQDLVGVLAWLVTAMTVLGALTLVTPALNEGVATSDLASVAGSGVLALVLWRRHDDPPPWLGHVGLVWVEVAILVTIADEADPGAAGFLHVLLVWIGVLVFTFLRPRAAWLHTVLVVGLASARWALAGEPVIDVAVASLLLLGTVGGVGMVVSVLVARSERLARSDDLTGVMNRRGVLELLEDRARRGHDPTDLLLLDLDGFKQVNDAGGHAAGDRVLRETAERWSATLPDGATLARFGGDEFLAVLPHTDVADPDLVVEQLRRATPDGIGVSVGAASWRVDESVEAALHRADEALYEEKARLARRAEDHRRRPA